MKISITEDERSIGLSIPNRLLLNTVTAYIAADAVNRYVPEGNTILPRNMRVFFEEVKNYRDKHGAWVLVEVWSADGRNIRVTL